MTERKKFKKGDLISVYFYNRKEDKWDTGLGIVVSFKETLQIARIYVQKTGKFLERVPYKYIHHIS